MKENLLLSIIIFYIAYRIFKFFRSYKRVFNALGYKYVFVGMNVFVIKKLSPLDFSEDGVMPFTFFKVRQPRNAFNEIREEIAAQKGKTKAELKEEYEGKLAVAKKIVEAGVVRYPDACLSAEDMFKNETMSIGWRLYNKVMEYNAPKLTKLYLWTERNAIAIHQRAKTYGTSPSMLIDPRGRLTDIEACIFDDFIYGIGLKYDNDLTKKRNLEIKKAPKKRR